MQGFEIAVTLKGKSIAEVIAQAQALIDADSTTAVAAATTGKRGRKTRQVEEATDEAEVVMTEDTAADDGDQLGFDMTADDEAEEEAPKATKAKKFTDKDVNTAAMAHAKKHGRPATLKILNGKFKVKSVLELKPDQYGLVIKALSV